MYVRLHYLPPLESKSMDNFIEKVRKLWMTCGGQGAETTVRFNKRKLQQATVLPVGNAKGGSRSSRALASKSMRAKRLKALVEYPTISTDDDEIRD